MPSLSEAQILELKNDLTCLQKDIEEALVSADESAQVQELDQAKVGRLSRMDALQQREMAVASKRNYQQRVKLIQQALKNIENDEYGFCKNCGEDIAFARLKARPESSLCIACKQNAE